MGFDAQVTAYLDRMAALGVLPNAELTPADARRQTEEMAAANFGPVEDVRAVIDTEIAGVPVRTYDPRPQAQLPVLVYLHGGGWVVGSRNTHDGPCRAIANLVPSRVVSVEYRLAPEHPFPAALDDSWAVARAVLKGAMGPVPVAVGGDSAGGNLAAVIARRARDENLPLALQLLVYPVTDCAMDTASYRRCATGCGMSAKDMAWYWHHYMGQTDRTDPDASPLRAPSLAGAAPAHVVVCENDVLHDEGVAYAERLKADGVPVTLRDVEGMIHGYIRMAAHFDRSRELWDDCAAALGKAFGAD